MYGGGAVSVPVIMQFQNSAGNKTFIEWQSGNCRHFGAIPRPTEPRRGPFCVRLEKLKNLSYIVDLTRLII